METFLKRLKKLGIELQLIGNYPWVYIDKIQGIRVTEKLDSEHGFVLGHSSIRKGQQFTFNNITETFKLIRKHVTKRT